MDGYEAGRVIKKICTSHSFSIPMIAIHPDEVTSEEATRMKEAGMQFPICKVASNNILEAITKIPQISISNMTSYNNYTFSQRLQIFFFGFFNRDLLSREAKKTK